MPPRPSKKPKVNANAKTPSGEQLQADQVANQKHRDISTKSILGKFQGRKSI